MPFRGKPSQGCDECRRQRKKCDLRAGGCSRCDKSKKKCSGYPMGDELRICDQSSEVIKKATGLIPKRKQKQQKQQKPLPLQNQSPPMTCPTLTFPRHISVSPARDDHSLAFFFRNYIVATGKRQASIDIPENEHLISSIKAVGYAGLSKNISDTRTMNLARIQYVEALKLTNTALRDPEQVTRDETLLAIMVLTNYETLTGGVDRTLEAWAQHIKGATSLLSLRGEQGLNHPDGRWLTLDVISSINIVCLRQNIPIPPIIYQIQKRLLTYLHDPNDPAWVLQKLTLLTVDYRHAVTHGLMTSTEDIVREAYDLDTQLASLLANPSASWAYEIQGPRTISPTTGLPDFKMLYWDQATAYVWCCVRATRIICLGVVLHALHAAATKGIDISCYEPDQLYMITAMRDMQAEILASTPQYLGSDLHVTELDAALGNSTFSLPPFAAEGDMATNIWYHFKEKRKFEMRDVMNSTLPTMRVMGGYGILWPLFATGMANTGSLFVKRYVSRVFRYLGTSLKIEQALLLDGILRRMYRDSFFDEMDGESGSCTTDE